MKGEKLEKDEALEGGGAQNGKTNENGDERLSVSRLVLSPFPLRCRADRRKRTEVY